jgi:hypothetical protein
MSNESQHDDELTPEEVEAQKGEPLPDREAMSLIQPPDGIATIAPEPGVPPLPPVDDGVA